MPRRKLSRYLKHPENYDGHDCLRCGYFWQTLKTAKYPVSCASCKNDYWDRPRKINKARA